MSTPLYQPRRRRVEMNLLPLIDVLVMLIFFAFVTMQFRSAQTLNLTLPKIETAGRNEFVSPIVISVGRDGTIVLNSQAVTDEQLEQNIAAIAAQGNDVTVLIKADEDTPVKRVTFAMDACRKRGLSKIRLQSR